MKLTKYGFRLNLLGFSSFLSVLGIVVSIIGIPGGITGVAYGIYLSSPSFYSPGGYYYGRDLIGPLFYSIGAGVLIITIPSLPMWILLKIKTSKQDIPGIERIGKVYSYVLGSLEIIGQIAGLIKSINDIRGIFTIGGLHLLFGIIEIIVTLTGLIFACLEIHAIRVENNKILGAYIGFRYAHFILIMIRIIVESFFRVYFLIVLIPFIPHIIFDIDLTVILHSIRVNRENKYHTG